jgi:hypothetical protein
MTISLFFTVDVANLIYLFSKPLICNGLTCILGSANRFANSSASIFT